MDNVTTQEPQRANLSEYTQEDLLCQDLSNGNCNVAICSSAINSIAMCGIAIDSIAMRSSVIYSILMYN